MNVTNCTLAKKSVEEYLQHLQDQTNLTLIPAVIMLSIFALTGLIGNILVLVVYSKKFRLSPTEVLIMTIASFDLVANVGAIPTEVSIMFDSWNFSNAALCKFKVFMTIFTTVGGAISLFAIAIVRYRKICRTYDWQVTIKQAQVTSVAAVAMTFLLCIPYIILSGITTIGTPCFNIKGYECLINDQYLYTVWTLLSHVLLILLYVFFSSSLVILYICIGVTAYRIRTNIRQFEKEKNTHTTCKASPPMEMKATTNIMVCQPINHTNVLIAEAVDEPDVAGQIQTLQDIHESPTNRKYSQNKRTTQSFSDCEQEQINENQEKHVTHTNLSLHQISPQRESKPNSLGSNRKTNRNNLLGRMTVMLIIISAIFVFGFIPYLVLPFVRIKHPDRIASSNMAELSAYHLFYRLYFVNSAVNPIIYSLCSIKFRRACIQLFTFISRRQV